MSKFIQVSIFSPPTNEFHTGYVNIDKVHAVTTVEADDLKKMYPNYAHEFGLTCLHPAPDSHILVKEPLPVVLDRINN